MKVNDKSIPVLLSGGGEMGELIRSFDWSKTAIGGFETWPQSLRVALGIMLDSPFGMYIAWGKDFIQMYNDGYRPILGTTKHPQALGNSTRNTFGEIWPTIGPMFDRVMQGTPVGFNDFTLELNRNGFLEECVFDFSYSPIRLESGEVGGVLVTVIETTEKVHNLKKLAESNDELNFAIEATELGTWDFNPLTNTFTGNNRLKEWFGLSHADDIDLSLAIGVMAEKDRTRVADAIKNALQFESGGTYDIEYTIINPQTKRERIVRAKGKAWFGEDKTAYRFNGTLQDITEQVIVRKKAEKSEQLISNERMVLYNSFMNAPAGIAIIKGENLSYEFANAAFEKLVGKKITPGKTVLEHFPEVEQQGYINLLKNVFEKGEPFVADELLVELDTKGDGNLEKLYLNLVVQPLQDKQGKPERLMAHIVNATAQVEARKEIEASEQRFSNIINQVAAGIPQVDMNGKFIDVNERFCDIVGYSREALLQLRMQDITHPADSELNKDLFETGVKEKKKYFIEKRYLKPDGSVVWVSNSVSFVKGVGVSSDFMTAVCIDITENKRAEEQRKRITDMLNGQKQAFEQLVNGESLLAVLNTIATTAENQSQNKIFASILLLEEDRYLKHGAAPGLPKAYIDAIDGVEIGYGVGSCGTAAFSGKEVIVEDIAHDPLWKNFKDLALAHGLHACWSTPILSSKGKVLATFALYYPQVQKPSAEDRQFIDMLSRTTGIVIEWYQDIAKRKEAEEALTLSENQFRTFAESIQSLAWIADSEGWIYWYNQRWYDYTKSTLEEMQGWGWDKVHHPDHVERVISYVKEAWKKDEAFELTFPLRRYDGVYRWFLTRAYPVKDAAGNIDRWIGTNTDITEQKTFTEKLEEKVKERTEELNEKNIQLEHTNAELTSFTYVASHDLQEPLRKIQTFGKRIIETEKFSDKTQEYFNRIIAAGERMQNLIISLLDFSRTNTTELIFMPCDLNDIVEESKNDLHLSIIEKDATVDYGKLPIINGAHVQLSQLFTNLIDNAIKYSRQDIKPHVQISAKRMTGNEIQHPVVNKQKEYHIIEIADNGIGFKKEYEGKIFELFQRLHGKNEYSGTGIGLAIVKKIVTNHSGFITARGNPGIGSTFTIYFPAS